MPFQSPRGADDILPSDAHKWLRLEAEFRSHAGLYGYGEIRTPTFEEYDLFVRTSGETSDIVSKEMYEFTDKGGRHMALKPEGTAPAARAAIQHSLIQTGSPVRLSYVTPIFRYGRPGKGRLREAHQVGLELIGSSSANADAEIIEVTALYYQRLGLNAVDVRLNSIGRQDCRARYREVVLSAFESYLKDQDEEFRSKSLKNPLRLIDSKDPAAAEIVGSLPPILDYLEPESAAHFSRLQELLAEAGVKFEVAPDIVRGLDYYTDTVFEVTSSQLGEQLSLCGGGRYDNLAKDLGGPPTPSVGVAMGIERALLVMDQLELSGSAARLDFYVVSATPDANPAVRELARDLRAAGVSATFDLDERKMSGQLKQADRAGARFAAILGEDELQRGVVVLRNLSDGQQQEVPRARATEAAKGLL